MKLNWLRRPLPRSLYGRAALILIVPIVTIQLVVSIVFIQRHFQGVTRQMTGTVVLEVDYLLRQVEGAADLPAAQRVVAALREPLALTVNLPAPADGAQVDLRDFWDLSGGYVIQTIRETLPRVDWVDLATNRSRVRLQIETRYGAMQVSLDRRRVSASNPHQLLVLMLVTSALMTVIAYGFLRSQLRPITRLADAAEAFGKGRSVPYKPRGATEVRAAGAAFLDMRNRIERQIEQRTLLLSGVSHDLRTPLTRLKLALAIAPEEEETALMLRDVEDMEGLLDSFLAFVRGDALDDPVPVEPVGLVGQVVDNARRSGQEVDWQPGPPMQPVRMRPAAIARALENLLSNARRYGGKVRVSAGLTERTLRLTVEDDGPGIPRARREEALRPFVRLDPARNQDKGSGVGLGLAIAIDIARSHGGTLRLGHSEALGGLKAELVLAR